MAQLWKESSHVNTDYGETNSIMWQYKEIKQVHEWVGVAGSEGELNLFPP